jgi:DNA-binding IclR family transcriptional regulator
MSAHDNSPSTTATARRPAPPVPRSVGRVLDLLEIVLAADGCNLTTAANEAGLTPTSALRHLRALEARGYLVRDDTGRFGVGPTMLRLAASLRSQGTLDDLIESAQPILDDLAAETGESAYLAIADGDTATYVASAESPRAIRHVGWIGQDVPLTSTALGAALRAPGTPAVRVGAVEPDIAAVSCAVPPIGTLRPAVSIVGPAQRLDGPALDIAAAAVTAAAGRLAAIAAPNGRTVPDSQETTS